MPPQITVDTSVPTQSEQHGIEMSPQRQSGSPTALNEKRSLLTVPGAKEHGKAGSSDTSSVGWDATTTQEQEKSRVEVTSHAKEMIQDTEQDTKPFAYTNKQLQAMMDPKDLEVLRQLGGLKGLTKGLQTDLQAGLSWDESTIPIPVSFEEAQAASSGEDLPIKSLPPVQQLNKKPTLGIRKTLTMRSTMKGSDDKMTDRKRVYGKNVLPARKTKNIFQLMWIALQDKVLIILSIAAVVSLALGLYETFDGPTEFDPLTGQPIPHIEWVEGVAIIVAIAIVTIVGSANDYQKERQFSKLNKKVRSMSNVTNLLERRQKSHSHPLWKDLQDVCLRRCCWGCHEVRAR